MKKQCFGEWGVVVQYRVFELEGDIQDVYWFNTKKEAVAEYKDKKKENTLTFIVRQIHI